MVCGTAHHCRPAQDKDVTKKQTRLLFDQVRKQQVPTNMLDCCFFFFSSTDITKLQLNFQRFFPIP